MIPNTIEADEGMWLFNNPPRAQLKAYGFDPTDKWMETKPRVENVLDDGRKINPLVARGSYGADAARLWAVLRTGLNDLARAYGVPPLGI